jgi:hypothetical protein
LLIRQAELAKLKATAAVLMQKLSRGAHARAEMRRQRAVAHGLAAAAIQSRYRFHNKRQVVDVPRKRGSVVEYAIETSREQAREEAATFPRMGRGVLVSTFPIWQAREKKELPTPKKERAKAASEAAATQRAHGAATPLPPPLPTLHHRPPSSRPSTAPAPRAVPLCSLPRPAPPARGCPRPAAVARIQGQAGRAFHPHGSQGSLGSRAGCGCAAPAASAPCRLDASPARVLYSGGVLLHPLPLRAPPGWILPRPTETAPAPATAAAVAASTMASIVESVVSECAERAKAPQHLRHAHSAARCGEGAAKEVKLHEAIAAVRVQLCFRACRARSEVAAREKVRAKLAKRTAKVQDGPARSRVCLCSRLLPLPTPLRAFLQAAKKAKVVRAATRLAAACRGRLACREMLASHFESARHTAPEPRDVASTHHRAR